MNKIHQLVWSARLGQCVAVSEVTGSAGTRRGGSAGRRTRRLAVASVLASALGVLGAAPALAQTAPAPTTLPTGGQLVQGQASLRGAGNAAAPVLNIDQSSQRAVINWSSFNLGSAATVVFNQPNAQAATLNRVQDANPSRIFGHIHATGQVTLINPNGVYFSPGAVLDVGALTATTMQQADADFMAGGASFTRGGSTGSVVNAGSLQAAPGGYIALLAPEVRNEGLIAAQQGTVALASGEAIRLNFDPQSRLASLTVSPSQIAALVENKTAVQVGGGQILLSATALSGLQGSVVNSGQLGASSLTARGGRIVLEGDAVALGAGSAITATGATGGGAVLVGGDWQGSGTMAQATTVTMEKGASIDASATQSGDGGKVVLWSDVHRAASVTTVNGRITAKGMARGGQVETSGHTVVLDTAQIDAGGRARAGQWLIDPYDYTIGAGQAATIGASLSSGTSVTVDTSANVAGQGSSGNVGDAGNIDVNASIAKTGGVDATLTLRAHNDIVVAPNVAIGSTANRLNVVLNSDQDGSGVGAIRLNTGSSITSNGGNITLGGGTAGDGSGDAVGSSAHDYGVAVVGATLNAGTGNISLRGKGGNNVAIQNYGVDVGYGAQILTSDGNISLVGTGGGSAGTGDNDGVRIGDVTIRATGTGNLSIQGTGGVGATGNSDGVVAYSSLATIETASGNLGITGTGNGPGTDSDGIYLRGTMVRSGAGSITLTGISGGSGLSEGVVMFGNTQVSASAGGNIGITGTGGGAGGVANVVSVNNSSIDAASGSVTISGTLLSGSSSGSSGIYVGSSSVVSAQGALSLTGNANGVAGANGVVLKTSASLSTSNASPITITTDSYSGDGTETVSAGTGTVTLQNLSAGTRIDLGGADVLTGSPPTLGLGSAELDRITAGRLVVGRNDASAAGAVTVSSAIAPTSATHLTLETGAGIAIDAPITLGGNSVLALTAAGNVSQSVGGNITASQLLLNGPGDYALATAGANAVGAIAAAGAGAVGFQNSGALQIGTVDGVSGIGASGLVSIGTASGDLTLAQSVATTDTSAGAVLLNAGVASAAGTAGGGNIVFSGSPVITTGSGGRATLYTGSIAGSPDVSAWVGPGSGHFRYNSDEATSNFSTALSGGGSYAIYREQPTMTMTGATASMVYGASMPTLASASGAINGDVIPATATVGGSLSTAGHYTVAGPHTVTPDTSPATALGYAVNATDGALTVTPATLNVTGSAASNKVYDKTTAATVTGGTLVGVLGGDVTTLTQAGTFAAANAGNGIAVSGNDSLGGPDAGNYLLTQPTGLSANITARELTVGGSVAGDKVYDRTTTATISGGTLLGVIGGDSVTLTQAGSFATANAGNGIAVIASDSLGGADSGNYSLTQPAGVSASIAPRPVTLQGASGLAKTYDGNTDLPAAGYGALSGVIPGDSVLAQGIAAYAAPNAGSQAVVQGSVALRGPSAGNYRLAWVDGTGTIAPAALTVFANNDARFVTQADVQGYNGVSYSGFVNGETNAVLAGSAVVTRSNPGTNGAGDYAGVLVPGGLSAANYAITFAPGNYTIVPANQLLVRLPNVQSTYGSNVIYGPAQASYLAGDNTTIVDLSNAVSAAGNTLTVTDGASGTASFTVAPVNARVGGGGALAVGSYQLGASRVTATSANFSNNLVVVGAQQVDAKGVTLTHGGASKVYDGTVGMTGLQLVATGLVAGDNAAPVGKGEFASRDVGTGLSYSVTGLHLEGADAGNYYVIGGTSQSGTDGVITPSALAPTAPVVTKIYDGAALYPADATSLAGLTRQLGETGCGVMMQVETAGGADGASSDAVESIWQSADGPGFEFELPAQAARALREQPGRPVARRADGSALPAWLVFDAERLRLHALAVPPGGLPLELAVRAGRDDVRLTIATRLPNGRAHSAMWTTWGHRRPCAWARQAEGTEVR